MASIGAQEQQQQQRRQEQQQQQREQGPAAMRADAGSSVQQGGEEGLEAAAATSLPELEQQWGCAAGSSLHGLAPRELHSCVREPNPFG